MSAHLCSGTEFNTDQQIDDTYITILCYICTYEHIIYCIYIYILVYQPGEGEPGGGEECGAGGGPEGQPGLAGRLRGPHPHHRSEHSHIP